MQKQPVGLKSTNNSPSPATKTRNDINKNKKQSNKSCPFACPHCQSLGGDLVKSKYEIVNILSDTGDSIFSPMHKRYHDDDDYRSLRHSGRVFLSADLVDSFFQQKIKK